MMASKEDLMERAKAEYELWRPGSGDYRSRFCYELVELEDRIERLEQYIANQLSFPEDDSNRIELLVIQLHSMKTYREVMRLRYKNNRL
jgi:hypothetical protein